jgi:uncharacterized protein (DUF302 family)
MVDGLVTLPSVHSVTETIDRLENLLRGKDITIFARIDHAAGALAANLSLRPTLLLIFGNAKGGTPLMQSAQTMGIDLPLKMLAREDADGKVLLSYNDPAWLAKRHGLSAASDTTIQAMRTMLEDFAKTATA